MLNPFQQHISIHHLECGGALFGIGIPTVHSFREKFAVLKIAVLEISVSALL